MTSSDVHDVTWSTTPLLLSRCLLTFSRLIASYDERHHRKTPQPQNAATRWIASEPLDTCAHSDSMFVIWIQIG